MVIILRMSVCASAPGILDRRYRNLQLSVALITCDILLTSCVADVFNYFQSISFFAPNDSQDLNSRVSHELMLITIIVDLLY